MLSVQTKEVLQAMLKDAKQPSFKLLRVDGGASRNNLLMQLQADAIQVCRLSAAQTPTRALSTCYYG